MSLCPFLTKVGDPDVPSESARILCESAAGVSALLQKRRSPRARATLAESWDMAVEDTEAARRWVQDVTASSGAAGGQGGDDQGIDNMLITGGDFHQREVTNSVSSAEKNGGGDTTEDWYENELQT